MQVSPRYEDQKLHESSDEATPPSPKNSKFRDGKLDQYSTIFQK